MGKLISRVLFWTYPRGSWQYDLLCIIIIFFIFLSPFWFFDEPKESSDQFLETDLVIELPEAKEEE